MTDGCIFCSIIAGSAPAEIIDCDETTLSLLDINPWTEGHALVISRRHAQDVYDIAEADLASVATSAQRLAHAMRDKLGCSGVNLLNCSGSSAWQTVWHFHIHVIPRYRDDPLTLPARPRPAERDALTRVAKRLRG
jgi:histidine triad (HIT) family protein